MSFLYSAKPFIRITIQEAEAKAYRRQGVFYGKEETNSDTASEGT